MTASSLRLRYRALVWAIIAHVSSHSKFYKAVAAVLTLSAWYVSGTQVEVYSRRVQDFRQALNAEIIDLNAANLGSDLQVQAEVNFEATSLKHGPNADRYELTWPAMEVRYEWCKRFWDHADVVERSINLMSQYAPSRLFPVHRELRRCASEFAAIVALPGGVARGDSCCVPNPRSLTVHQAISRDDSLSRLHLRVSSLQVDIAGYLSSQRERWLNRQRMLFIVGSLLVVLCEFSEWSARTYSRRLLVTLAAVFAAAIVCLAIHDFFLSGPTYEARASNPRASEPLFYQKNRLGQVSELSIDGSWMPCDAIPAGAVQDGELNLFKAHRFVYDIFVPAFGILAVALILVPGSPPISISKV